MSFNSHGTSRGRWAAPNKLRQLQYRSYVYTISIYHFPHTNVPLRHFEARLTRQAHGFVARLFSDDPLTSLPVDEDDKAPDGYYEVAYLPNAFQCKGCALGFRIPRPAIDGLEGSQDRGKIEWFCFEKSFLDSIEAWTIEVVAADNDADEAARVVPLFDQVATLEKAAKVKKGTVKGYKEHREWFGALERAVYPVVNLKLTWKNEEMDRQRDLTTIKEAAVLADRNIDDVVVDCEGIRDRQEDLEMHDVCKDSGWEDDGDQGEDIDGGDGNERRVLTPNLGPLSKPTTAWKSKMDRLAGGEYV
jgi:hypothetical protein